MAIYLRRVTVVDYNGALRTFQITGNASTSTIEAALLLLSNADEQVESEAQLFVNSSPAPIPATYQSVSDVAVLVFVTTAGTTVTLTVPAPRSSIFLADQFTVDPASVASLLALATGLVCDLAGNTVTAFQAGFRAKE